MSATGGLVYVVDDDASVREGVASLVRSAGLEAKALASGQEFLALPRSEIPSCLVLDVQLPGLSGLDVQQELLRSGANLPIIFLTGYGNIPMTVRAIQAGAAEFLTKPFEKEELLSAIRRCFGGYHKFNRQPRDQFNDELTQEKRYLKDETRSEMNFGEIIGNSASLRGLLKQVITVAPTDSTVLIYGETGTGKELIAHSIHKNSQRSGRAFVGVNCAALPPSLIPSELFGHEKGAFTGAMQRRLGRFELADGGTIFLDEVGEILPDTQVALLRVLQEREFERVGGGRPIRVDVRVIAATNRDLKTAVANGIFRQDLFYRLNVFPVEVPPLRERKDDILMLVEYFVQLYATRAGKHIRSIDKKTLELLRSYDWPGNIRELQNMIERSVILSAGEILSVDELWLSKETTPPASQVKTSMPFKGEVESRSEREIIETALAETRGRVSGPSGAATKLGIPPSTLNHRIKALEINKKQFKFR